MFLLLDDPTPRSPAKNLHFLSFNFDDNGNYELT